MGHKVSWSVHDVLKERERKTLLPHLTHSEPQQSSLTVRHNHMVRVIYNCRVNLQFISTTYVQSEPYIVQRQRKSHSACVRASERRQNNQQSLNNSKHANAVHVRVSESVQLNHSLKRFSDSNIKRNRPFFFFLFSI